MLRQALGSTLLLMLLLGAVYPATVTILGQALFPSQANGSLIVREGRVVGSRLIGQGFEGPQYFHPRPSAAGAEGYDGGASGGSNLGPMSRTLAERLRTTAATLRADKPEGVLPVDLLTASASGLDPNITPEGAHAQVERVAKARRMSRERVAALVDGMTEERDWGIFGLERVNVLLLNNALDAAE